MKYKPTDILRKFVMRQCIQHLVETSETAVWLNLTFWENVTEKAYANKCWNRLKMTLMRKYPNFRLVGVWARQGRGAWHVHAVCNQRVEIEWFRRKVMRAGFGTQIYVRELDSKLETPAKIARYITGYCTDKNALDPERDKGVRRTIFLGKHVRVVNMRYRSSLKKVTSVGRDLARDFMDTEYSAQSDFHREYSPVGGRKKVWETWGQWYKRNRDYWFRLGWDSLSDEVQKEMIELDKYCVRYFETGQWSYI